MSHSFRTWTIAFLLAWFGLALTASLLGVFDSQPRPPLLLGAAALLPPIAFEVALQASAGLRRAVAGADVRALTAAQTWRVGGVVFLILHQRGLLPGSFAYPAGWGDIAIGATAPLVAWAVGTGRLARAGFVGWNALGILDLVMAIALGVLSFNSPVGILAGDVTTQVMGRFPLSLIPTFFVPLLLICHLIALNNFAAAGATASPRATPSVT